MRKADLIGSLQDLIMSEQQNIRELELIIKVFRPPFVELFPNSKVCELCSLFNS